MAGVAERMVEVSERVAALDKRVAKLEATPKANPRPKAPAKAKADK
jgi:hypothetical protein